MFKGFTCVRNVVAVQITLHFVEAGWCLESTNQIHSIKLVITFLHFTSVLCFVANRECLDLYVCGSFCASSLKVTYNLKKSFIFPFLNISRKEKYLLKRAFVSVVLLLFLFLLLCSKMLIFVTFYINPKHRRYQARLRLIH